MRLMTPNFSMDDDIRVFFRKYIDESGISVSAIELLEHFPDANSYLCDADYRTLYKKLAKEGEWGKCDLNMFLEKLERRKDKIVYYWCFLFYLREATFRYAQEVAGDGGFWESMDKGISRDLMNIGIDSFWCRSSEKTIRAQLVMAKQKTKYGDNSLHGFICLELGMNVPDGPQKYVSYFVNISGCPLNYNPCRSKYAELRDAYIRNDVAGFIELQDRNTLDKNEYIREALVQRIEMFFDDVGHWKALYQKKADWQYLCSEIKKHYGISSPDHYYLQWLRQELSNHKNDSFKSAKRVKRINVFEISYNWEHSNFSVIEPSSLDINEIFNNDNLEWDWEYGVSDGETILFKIEQGNIVKDDKSRFKKNILKLLALRKICLIDGSCKIECKNPWKGEDVLLFPEGCEKARHYLLSQKKNYLFLHDDYSIENIENAEFERDDNPSGINVFNLTPKDGAEEVVLTIKKKNGELRKIEYDVQDPVYVHLYEPERIKTCFFHQTRDLKVGIGTMEFTHLPNANLEPVIENLNREMYDKYGMTHNWYEISRGYRTEKRLKISNCTSKILFLDEQLLNQGTKIPAAILLPEGAEFWMAENEKSGAKFKAYVFSPGNISNLDYKKWELESMRGGGYRYEYKECSEDWETKGYPIEIDNKIVYPRPPYWLDKDLDGDDWKQTRTFFLNSNPCKLYPENGEWFFKWKEYNCRFDVQTPICSNSIDDCRRALGLEGYYPDMEFGWTYKETSFKVALQGNCTNPLCSRPDAVYEASDNERTKWLESLLSTSRKHLKDALNNWINIFCDKRGVDKTLFIQKLKMGWFLDGKEDIRGRIIWDYFSEITKFRRDLSNLTENQVNSWLNRWDEQNAKGENGWFELFTYYVGKGLSLTKISSPQKMKEFFCDVADVDSFASGECLREWEDKCHDNDIDVENPLAQKVFDEIETQGVSDASKAKIAMWLKGLCSDDDIARLLSGDDMVTVIPHVFFEAGISDCDDEHVLESAYNAINCIGKAREDIPMDPNVFRVLVRTVFDDVDQCLRDNQTWDNEDAVKRPLASQMIGELERKEKPSPDDKKRYWKLIFEVSGIEKNKIPIMPPAYSQYPLSYIGERAREKAGIA